MEQRERTGRWNGTPAFKLAALAATAFMLGAASQVVAADRSCTTFTIDERIAGIERASERFGNDYRISVERASESVSNIILIIDLGERYEALKIIFLRGCQLPARGPRLDPDEAARQHFGQPLSRLFADEI